MPCMHPIPAWRSQAGVLSLGKEPPASTQTLQLPCGGCLGCRTSAAKAWALRCMLEAQDHDNVTFTTLTYDDEKLPVTLQRDHLAGWIKRLRQDNRRRKANRIRFFACGEYGEKTDRPHYHAILYGISAEKHDADRIDRAWKMGHTKTVTATPAAIAYTAGYVAKKIGYKYEADQERINYETGEVYHWQPPFLQMSRNPGIGANANKWAASWKDYAILGGVRIPVPKYLHQQWEKSLLPGRGADAPAPGALGRGADTPTQQQLQQQKQLIEEHEHEKYLRSLTKERMTKYMLEAEEKIAIGKQQLSAAKRKL